MDLKHDAGASLSAGDRVPGSHTFPPSPNEWRVSDSGRAQGAERVRCTRTLGSPCEDVAPAAWVLCILVRLTFDVFDDLEMSTLKRFGDLAWNMEAKIQGDGRAE